jgi:hypothetical protein
MLRSIRYSTNLHQPLFTLRRRARRGQVELNFAADGALSLVACDVGYSEEKTMRKLYLVAVLAALAAAPLTANAAESGERTVTGAAIGAGTGAVIAGPPGAVVGGVIGGVVGGPRVSRHRHCWHDQYGDRHCRYNN